MNKEFQAYAIIHSDADREDISTFLLAEPSVQAADYVSGEDAYVLRIEASSQAELAAMLRERLKRFPGAGETKTLIVLDSLKPARIVSGRIKQEPDNTKRVTRFLNELVVRGISILPLMNRMKIYDKPFMGAPTGTGGLRWYVYAAMNWVRVELYIERGDEAKNDDIFQQLYDGRAEIEKNFGAELSWDRDRLGPKQGRRISYTLNGGGYVNDEAEWPRIQISTTEAMSRLVGSLSEPISRLSI